MLGLTPNDLTLALGEIPIIGIVRGCPPDRIVEVATAARAGGMTTLEITVDSMDALTQLSKVKRAVSEIIVGVGTVISADVVIPAVEAGASFVVTPAFIPEVLTACVETGIPCLPGAATPTEIWKAYESGAYAVKVFPARELGGPEYISALRQPFPSVPLVPTGGVSLEAVPEYLRAGAHAVGVGGSLFSQTLMASGDASQLTSRVQSFVEASS